MAPEEKGDSILHQDEVEGVVSDELKALSTHAAIADLAAPSAGYVEAEALATRNAVNGILAVLRDEGVIPVS